MKTRVHISLTVSDIGKSVDFYSKLFQRAPTKLKPDYANFRMESPSLHLSLVKGDAVGLEESQSNRHYGIELFAEADLSQWLEAVNKSGIKQRTEENTTCCYAKADKFWVKDPDGNDWEFWVRHEEADTMFAAEEAAEKEGSCCAPGSC